MKTIIQFTKHFLCLALMQFNTVMLLGQCPNSDWTMNYYSISLSEATPSTTTLPFNYSSTSSPSAPYQYSSISQGYMDNNGNLKFYSVWNDTETALNGYKLELYNAVGSLITELAIEYDSKEVNVIPFNNSPDRFIIVYPGRRGAGATRFLDYIVLDLSSGSGINQVYGPFILDAIGAGVATPNTAVHRDLNGNYLIYANCNKEIKKFIVDFSMFDLGVFDHIVQPDLNEEVYSFPNALYLSELEVSRDGSLLALGREWSNQVSVIKINNAGTPNELINFNLATFQEFNNTITGVEFNPSGTELYVNFDRPQDCSGNDEGIYKIDLANNLVSSNPVIQTSLYNRSHIETGPNGFLYCVGYNSGTNKNLIAKINPMNFASYTEHELPDILPYTGDYRGYSCDIGYPGYFTLPDKVDNCAINTLPCENNTVMHFDGINDNIFINDIRINHDFSIGCWFKPASEIPNSLEDRLFAFGNETRFEIGINENGKLWRHDSKFSLGDVATFDNVRQDDQWHHVAVIGKGDNRQIYLDFELISDYNSGPIDYGDHFSIGNWNGGASQNQFYHGMMDDVRLYNTAVSKEDLKNAFGADCLDWNSNLLVSINFEDGAGGQDNSSKSSIANCGFWPDGIFEGFTLNGDKSNYICHDVQKFDCPNTDCSDECNSNTVNLSTGVNYNDGSLLLEGEYDGSWQMISGPETNITYPRPGFVVKPDPAWDQLSGAQYISPFSNANYNGQHVVPYLFERCFCVCENNAMVNIDIAALVDNFITIGLYDNSGNLIQELINYSGNTSTSTYKLPAFESNTSHSLKSGVYCLRAELRNDGAVSMGMAIKAEVTGAGLIENGCCSKFTAISGSCLIASQCNPSSNQNEPLVGIEVLLYNNQDEVISSTVTDDYGFFIFHNVEPGDYLIKQQTVSGYNLISGALGLPISVSNNEVSGSNLFGNCPIMTDGCCASDEELSLRAQEVINYSLFSFGDDPEECIFKISNTLDLYDCQYIGSIMWGDGELTNVGANDHIPVHDYEKNGMYLISVFVYSQTGNDFCQTDIIDLPLAYHDCCNTVNSVNIESTTKFSLYPNPTEDQTKLELYSNKYGLSGEVINDKGQVVESIYLPKNSLEYLIDTQNYVPGVYTIVLNKFDGQRLAARFIKI